MGKHTPKGGSTRLYRPLGADRGLGIDNDPVAKKKEAAMFAKMVSPLPPGRNVHACVRACVRACVCLSRMQVFPAFAGARRVCKCVCICMCVVCTGLPCLV